MKLWRRRSVTPEQCDEMLAWLDRVNDLAPCENPDCITARHELRVIFAERRTP